MNQAVLEQPDQISFALGQPSQNPLYFPQTLAEKYQPQTIDDLIGLERVKRFFKNLIASPRPCNILSVGNPGTGKTVAGMALANAVGSLIHISAQKLDVSSLDSLSDRLAYAPPRGFWVVVVDEVDGATDKAQLQLLSKMDGAASLRPTFGGGFVRGEPPPVIWMFSCNGKGDDGLKLPNSLAPRFVDRCMKQEFLPPTIPEMAAELERIWKLEGGGETEPGYFEFLAKGVGMRGALSKMDTDLLAGPRPVIVEPPLAVRTAAAETSSGIAEEHQTAVRLVLGERGVVWKVDGRYRAGIYTEKEGRWIEDGKKIVGTGTSPNGAIRDAVRRGVAV